MMTRYDNWKTNFSDPPLRQCPRCERETLAELRRGIWECECGYDEDIAEVIAEQKFDAMRDEGLI